MPTRHLEHRSVKQVGSSPKSAWVRVLFVGEGAAGMSQAASGSGDRFARWTLVAILLAAGLLRFGLVASRVGAVEDPDNYLTLARSMAGGEGFVWKGRPTAYRPPLYPLTLVPIVAMLGPRADWGVAVWHGVLGSLAVGATTWAARRWGLGPRRALVAAVIVAFDPVLLAESRGVMTENLAVAMIACALAALARPAPPPTGDPSANASELLARNALWAGVCFGLASLSRPSMLACLVMAALAETAYGSRSARVGLRNGALLVVAAVVVMSPWAARNAWALGGAVWTTTHGGYTLALANNDAYYDDVLNRPEGAVWTGPGQFAWFDRVNCELAGVDEIEADRRLRNEALRTMEKRPRDAVRAAVARLSRFWSLAPDAAVYARSVRVVVAVWTTPIWLALVLGLLDSRTRQAPRAVAAGMIVGLTIVHMFYWTDVRMRAPIVPAIALLAASARRGHMHRAQWVRTS